MVEIIPRDRALAVGPDDSALRLRASFEGRAREVRFQMKAVERAEAAVATHPLQTAFVELRAAVHR
jgi:hypothetical protein